MGMISETLNESRMKPGEENAKAIQVLADDQLVSLPTSRSIPTDHEMMVFATMAKQAVQSKMYKGIGDESGVMMIMLAARELGIPPMQALNGGLNIIQGKVELSARMMGALIRRAGHQITIKESTDLICTLLGRRADTKDTAIVSYTFAEAQKAGLVKSGGGWVKNPKDMCFARAMSRMARQLFSDVIGIGYIEGEIKPSDAELIMPEIEQDIPPEESEEEWIQAYLELFDREDRQHAMEYLKVVKDHFTWTTINTVKELIKDQKKLFDKFNQWKLKITKTLESK